MAKIIIETSSTAYLKKGFHQLDASVVSIGRGYDNDIIIQDAHVSSHHVTIRLTDEGWIVEDMRSRNGLFLLKKKKGLTRRFRLEEPHSLRSGDAFLIGNTLIRVFLPEHRIAPTKRMEHRGLFLASINNSINAWYAIIGFFVVYYAHGVLSFSEVDISNGQIFLVESMGFLGVVFWSGIWAFVGRVIRHRSKFRLHLTLATLFCIVMVPLTNFAQYLGFIFSNPFVEGLFLMVMCGFSFALLLVCHLAISTFLSLRARWIFSALVPAIFYGLIMIGQVAMEAEFHSAPRHYVRLKPSFVRPLFVKSQEEFLDGMSDLFKKEK